MGQFTINISAKVDTPYQTRYNSFSKGSNCSGFIFEQGLSIASESPIVDTVILLAPWMMGTAGLTLKTMHIKEVINSDPNSLWYEYNGTKLISGVEYTIDITGLGYEDVIPLFKLKGEQVPFNVITQTVDCKIALEDTSLVKYEYRNNKMTVYYSEC